MPSNMWDEITYPFLNFNDQACINGRRQRTDCIRQPGYKNVLHIWWATFRTCEFAPWVIGFNSLRPSDAYTGYRIGYRILLNRFKALTIIGSDNGLSPGRRQPIIWTSAGILLIGPLGTNFSEILIGIQTFLFKKMHLKMSSAKWRPSCLGLNVLNVNRIVL